MTKKFISVERANVALNREYKENCAQAGVPLSPALMAPCIYIEFEDGSPPMTVSRVLIKGQSELVYRPHNFEPGDPNAHVWIETDAPVAFIATFGDEDYSEGGYLA